ncbi:MAG TPA: MmgE/PrpD family protein [Vicinamibacterales bacterium]|nr:MmgE/PrpD family protein [Vicinamibacterales bacterium]
MARLHNRPQFGDLSPKAIDHAKILIASTVAAAASGSTYPSSRIIRELAKEQGGKAQATIWFDGTKLPMPEAARVNSVLANAAAADDTDIDSSTHPGPELVPTGIVVAEGTGASGQDLVAAIVTGFEAQNRMGAALRGGKSNGMYASQTVAFGAVVIAGRLLKLTDEQLAHAIGITAMTMGGLAIGTDSPARDYGGSNAAICAVNAALAAGRGFTVNEDMLEARGGFVEVFGAGHTEPLTADLKEWAIAKFLSIKLEPGVWTYSTPVEATINAVRKGNVSPDEVAKILVSGPRFKSINGSRHPRSFHEAIHSLPYFVASAVSDRDFSWIHATPAKISSPVAAQLMPLVDVDPSPNPVRYDSPLGATVTIVTKSGATYTSTIQMMKGSAPRGIEWSDIDFKYHALMPNSRLAAKHIEEALNTLHHLEELKSVSELTRMLQPG